MAKLELEPQWTLKVTSRELALIRGALGDRLSPDDREAAKALDDNLSRQVIGQTKSQMDRVKKLAENMGEAE